MDDLYDNGKTKNIIIALLSVLCVILLIYVIYSLSNKNKPTEENKVEKEAVFKEARKEELASVNSKLTVNYLDNTIKAFNNPLANRSRDLNLDIYGYYYRRNSLEIEKMSKYAFVYIGLYDFATKTYARTDLMAGKEMCVSKDTVHNTVKNKFGNFTFDDMGPNDELRVYGDLYKFKIDEYCAFIGGGRGGPNEAIENIVTGYKEYSDKIEVFVKTIFIYYENAESMGELPIAVKLFKDIDRSYLVDERGELFEVKDLTKEDLNKFQTYKFTYKIDKDNLYFYSVEKTNE